MDKDKFTEELYRLCRLASLQLLDLYQRHQREPLSIVTKPDGSPVTEADTLVQAILIEGMAKLLPGVPVISEEAQMPALTERRRWQRYWLLDPLDGTREFIAGTGHFCINVALVEAGEAVWGAIFVPLTGEMYVGGKGCPAEVYRAGQVWPLRPRAARMGGVLKLLHSVRGSRHRKIRELKSRLAQCCPCVMEELRGSAWKFCRLAEGGGQIYARFGETSEWDTAAGQALLESVGGAVLDQAGRPLRYNDSEDMRNPDFYALAPAEFSWEDVLALGGGGNCLIARPQG